MFENGWVRKLEKLHEELGWLLSRAQLALDESLRDLHREYPASEVPGVDGIPCSAQLIGQPARALRIFIGGFPPVGRVFAAPAYAREVSYSGIREQWVGLIGSALKKLTSAGLAVPQFDKAVVIFTFLFKGNLRRDPDRFQVKFILDALSWAGVLEDDGITNIVVILRGVTGLPREGTEIVVADLYDKVLHFAEAVAGGNPSKL